MTNEKKGEPPLVALIGGEKDPNKVPHKKSAEFAAPAPGSCQLGGSSYPNGSQVNYGGKVWTCQNGVWV